MRSSWPSSLRPRSSDPPRPGNISCDYFLKAAFGAEKRKKHVLYLFKQKKKGVSLISSNILVHHCLLQRVTFEQLINNFHKANSLSHKATAQGTQRRRVILFCHPGSHHRHRRVLRFPSAFGASAIVPWLLSGFPANSSARDYVLHSLLILVRNNTSLATNSRSRQLSERVFMLQLFGWKFGVPRFIGIIINHYKDPY